MRFLVDQMLGKLAKYLRFLGYDTYYTKARVTDKYLLELAVKEQRILITRDKSIALRESNSIYLRSTDYRQQLSEVVKKLDLNKTTILSRCSLCNGELMDVEKDTVKGKVPENIYNHISQFYKCIKCEKIYWYGSHTKKIMDEIDRIFQNK